MRKKAYTGSMDETQRLVQAAPAWMFAEHCDHGHLHVQLGWISYMPPQRGEDHRQIIQHPVSGEFYRPLVDLTFSLN